MKYKYYDKGDRLIAESDSPIQFNVARFPIWKSIKPVVMEEKKKVIKKATVEVAKDEELKQPTKKKKKSWEDDS